MTKETKVSVKEQIKKIDRTGRRVFIALLINALIWIAIVIGVVKFVAKFG